MEKDVGLSFNATITVEEARKKLRVPFQSENQKIDVEIKKSFIDKIVGRMFKKDGA
jgi:hypothetical protein